MWSLLDLHSHHIPSTLISRALVTRRGERSYNLISSGWSTVSNILTWFFFCITSGIRGKAYSSSGIWRMTIWVLWPGITNNNHGLNVRNYYTLLPGTPLTLPEDRYCMVIQKTEHGAQAWDGTPLDNSSDLSRISHCGKKKEEEEEKDWRVYPKKGVKKAEI